MKKNLLIFTSGFCLAFLLNLLAGTFSNRVSSGQAWAQKPAQLDIIYRIVTQDYYLTQKLLAFNEYQADVLQKIAEKNKVDMEKILPLKNRLQQELFQLDLKIKEVNR